MKVEDRPVTPRARRSAHGVSDVAAALAAALAMLTRIPAGRSSGDATGAAAYGVVGALVGAVGLIPLVVLGGAVPPLAAIVAIGAMAVVSGGVHLDGLADTADALLAPDPTRAEAARKDPAIGSGGATALILVIAAQVAALASLVTEAGPLVAGLACVAGGAASRALPVALVRMRGGAAVRSGLGSWFADRVGRADVLLAVAGVAGVTIAAGLLDGSVVVPAAVTVGSAFGLAAGLALVAWRGQLDGDVFGATVELGFAAILGVAAVAATGSLTVTWPAR